MERKFSLSKEHAPKAGLTISTRETESGSVGVTYFSLGKDTDISAERYPEDVLYLGNFGSGEFRLRKAVEDKEQLRGLAAGEAIMVKKNTLCGVRTAEGFIYTEVIPGKDINMNEQVKAGEVFQLANLLPYEKGSVVNMDVASNPNMKLVLMAFDAGTGLSEHSAPGDALIFALEGEVELVYEGTPHKVKAGEQFHMAKGGRHSLKAEGQFKMALLLTLA